ncbi:MAG: HAMP domain-containing sensor histidine kinase [Gammaproteobacteria bacterium]|nr:HAMP domain-containing sensor histidine kinase [Gammaproteobacteria bacterium]
MLKRLRQSLITRLMLYFVLVGILIMVLFGVNFAHGLRVHFKQEILPNIAQYLDYIVQDIGTPPDLQKAAELTQDLSFELAIVGPDLNWQSTGRMARYQQLEFENAPAPYQQFQIAHRRGLNFVVYEVQGYDFVFAIGRPFKGQREQRNIGLFVAVLLSMLVLFLLIRSSLKPLQTIGEGVKRIGDGDLDSHLDIRNSIEFQRLADGINAMARQIESMLEGKQQLLLAISHELRSPLTRARVNLELMPEHPAKQALIDDCNEMEALINQILESQRLNQRHAVLNKTEFQLDELINEILQSYFSQQQIDSQLQPLEYVADRTRISLLIKNLLDNAVKYSGPDDPPPQIRLYAEPSAVIVEVEDFGIGMAEAELDKITQAFYRIDQARQRSTGGFGLGLYLCMLIVNAHQGQMTFTSSVEQGTLVRVTLPK